MIRTRASTRRRNRFLRKMRIVRAGMSRARAWLKPLSLSLLVVSGHDLGKRAVGARRRNGLVDPRQSLHASRHVFPDDQVLPSLARGFGNTLKSSADSPASLALLRNAVLPGLNSAASTRPADSFLARRLGEESLSSVSCGAAAANSSP